MQWIAPSEKDTDNAALEKRLWDAADQFRANSGLKAQEYSAPVLGLIFLRFAEVRFAAQRVKLEKPGASSRRDSRVEEPAAYYAEGGRADSHGPNAESKTFAEHATCCCRNCFRVRWGV